MSRWWCCSGWRAREPSPNGKWYAFDLIVTVALGSTFANSVLSGNISVAQSLVGFVILIGLQFIIAFLVANWSGLRIVVNPQPTLLLQDGKFLHDAMRRQRVAEADVRAAIRQHGIDRVEDVGAVVLEADGTFSVIKELGSNATALADIPELGGSNAANRSD
jgi:uncharacterized membrane protein YcaP (DUF421 family)